MCFIAIFISRNGTDEDNQDLPGVMLTDAELQSMGFENELNRCARRLPSSRELRLGHLNIEYIFASNDWSLDDSLIEPSTAPLVLYLQFNFLSSVPNHLFQGPMLVHLTEINRSHNALKSVPDTIGNLCHLKELHLSFNLLENLPVSLARLTQLTVLDVTNNLLRWIPGEILSGLSIISQIFAGQNRFNILDTRHSKQRRIQSLFQRTLQVVGKTLEHDAHFYCSNTINCHPCLHLPMIVQEAVSIASFESCSFCSARLYGDSPLRRLQIIVRYNQPLVSQSLFCCQEHCTAFSKEAKSFSG